MKASKLEVRVLQIEKLCCHPIVSHPEGVSSLEILEADKCLCLLFTKHVDRSPGSQFMTRCCCASNFEPVIWLQVGNVWSSRANESMADCLRIPQWRDTFPSISLKRQMSFLIRQPLKSIVAIESEGSTEIRWQQKTLKWF
jgi:hypothetical protein